MLILNLSSYYNYGETQEETEIGWVNATMINRITNYKYEKEYSLHDFEEFLRGENQTLIIGYPELLYDDTILLDYFETIFFYRTETAYYLLTKQHSQKSVMYRFQQVGDDITQYIKYELLRG